jgi:hypothetical protein
MLPITDILHRGLVLSLAGLSVYGIFLGVAVHRETLQKGRGEPANFLGNWNDTHENLSEVSRP